MQLQEMEEEEFQAWLIGMDSALDEFMDEVHGDVATHLDYCVESLDVLEAALLSLCDSYETAFTRSVWPQLDRAAQYVGEVVRRNLGGAWRLSDGTATLQPIGSVPEVYHPAGRHWPLSPHTLVLTALDRRVGNSMSARVAHVQSRMGGEQLD